MGHCSGLRPNNFMLLLFIRGTSVNKPCVVGLAMLRFSHRASSTYYAGCRPQYMLCSQIRSRYRNHSQIVVVYLSNFQTIVVEESRLDLDDDVGKTDAVEEPIKPATIPELHEKADFFFVYATVPGEYVCAYTIATCAHVHAVSTVPGEYVLAYDYVSCEYVQRPIVGKTFNSGQKWLKGDSGVPYGRHYNVQACWLTVARASHI